MIGHAHTGTAAIFNSTTEGVDKSGVKAVNSKNPDLGFYIYILQTLHFSYTDIKVQRY